MNKIGLKMSVSWGKGGGGSTFLRWMLSKEDLQLDSTPLDLLENERKPHISTL